MLTSAQAAFQSPVMYSSIRTSPSARPQSYHAGLAMPAPGLFMHDGMRYGAPMQLSAQHGGGRGRRHDDANAAFRSPLLEEFRNSKDRKWTLKVRAISTTCPFDSESAAELLRRTFTATSQSSARTSMARGSSSRRSRLRTRKRCRSFSTRSCPSTR